MRSTDRQSNKVMDLCEVLMVGSVLSKGEKVGRIRGLNTGRCLRVNDRWRSDGLREITSSLFAEIHLLECFASHAVRRGF